MEFQNKSSSPHFCFCLVVKTIWVNSLWAKEELIWNIIRNLRNIFKRSTERWRKVPPWSHIPNLPRPLKPVHPRLLLWPVVPNLPLWRPVIRCWVFPSDHARPFLLALIIVKCNRFVIDFSTKPICWLMSLLRNGSSKISMISKGTRVVNWSGRLMFWSENATMHAGWRSARWIKWNARLRTVEGQRILIVLCVRGTSG